MCAYDRAGFGWSDPGPAPRDARQNMQELRTLLTNAAIPGPYVLVGHSFGANVSRLYVASYPGEVAGMVLVDPGWQFDIPGVPPEVNAAWKSADQITMRLAPLLSRLGLMRLSKALGAIPGHGDLPPQSGEAFDALNLTTKFWDTLKAQSDAMPATSAQVLSTTSNLGTLPLVVLVLLPQLRQVPLSFLFYFTPDIFWLTIAAGTIPLASSAVSAASLLGKRSGEAKEDR